MREIPLSQGKVALVDDEDYEWLNQWKWYASNHGHTFYAKRSIKGDCDKKVYMHVQLLGKKGGFEIEPVNQRRGGDTLRWGTGKAPNWPALVILLVALVMAMIFGCEGW